jgi:predicted PurR-regulated permease PerM
MPSELPPPPATPNSASPPAPSILPDPASEDASDERRGVWKSGDVARGALVVLAVWLALQLLWSANALVFVVFLGVLFGVATATGVDVLERRGIRRGIGSAIIVFGSVGLLGLTFSALAPTLVLQARELQTALPEALGKAQELINKREFGFLDPFLRPPESDSTAASDSAAAKDSADSANTPRPAARPRPVTPPPTPRLDSQTLEAVQQISRAIDDSLQARNPRPRSVDSGLFLPGRPVLPTALVDDSAANAPTASVLSEISPQQAADEALEARTRFLRDSLRRVMQDNIAAAERRARQEVLESGVIAGPREPTRGELLTRRVTSGLAGSSRQLFSFVTGTVVALGSLVLVMFLAIYIGAEPKLYVRWILSVVPAEHRGHVGAVFEGIAMVLRKWLVTQLVAMVVIGVVSTVALLVLDVRAPFALGFIAGLLEFVPTVGPILAAIPAVAMGFIDSPQKALAVLITYWVIQFVENNLLIPALMRGEMDLPPAITLVAQALMAVLFGFLGLMVAVPLTAAVLVPLRMYAATQDVRQRALLREQIEKKATA